MVSDDTSDQPLLVKQFLGLAPFLRKSIAGIDVRPIAQALLGMAEQDADNANLLMNLSNVMQCIGQHDVGLAIQQEALALQRVFHLGAPQQPASLRLLMVMAPGDLAANTPLECLLENTDIDLDFYYLSDDEPFAASIPEHDVLIVCLNEADEHLALLELLEQALSDWPKPVINAPQNIHYTDRHAASELLQNVPGLLIPPTIRITRQTLLNIAVGKMSLSAQIENCNFPVILRPLDSYGGHGLDKIESAEDIPAYLEKQQGATFFLSAFINYSNEDGLFRKYRIVLINGQAYICHMAISSHWVIHYLNAGMYDDAQKRSEEADFMLHFDVFAQRHKTALKAIYTRTGLDYVCIDCAETTAGQLLIFEIDHVMVIHAMDPEALFAYKQVQILKIEHAFRDYLLRLKNKSATDYAS